jgi:hypothetical protein
MTPGDIGKGTSADVKRDRFIRIVERRVNAILEELDNLGKCSNERNYKYSQEDVWKIFREIDKKVKDIKLLFQGEVKEKRRFKL